MQNLYFKGLKTDNFEVCLGNKKIADVVRVRDRFVYSITILESGETIEVGILPEIIPAIKKKLIDNEQSL